MHHLSHSGPATPRKMPGSVICVVTNHDQLGSSGNKTGWYLPEVAHPYEVFTKAGYDVTFVSPKGVKAPMVSTCTRCCQTYTDSKKKRFISIIQKNVQYGMENSVDLDQLSHLV